MRGGYLVRRLGSAGAHDPRRSSSFNFVLFRAHAGLARADPPARHPQRHRRAGGGHPRALGPERPGPSGRHRCGRGPPGGREPVRQVHRRDGPGATSGSSFVARGQDGPRRPRPAALADAAPVRAGRAHRDHPRAGPRRLLGLATRRPGRLRRQRRLARPLRDAVLPARDDVPAARSARSSAWFPTFGMLTAGASYSTRLRPPGRPRGPPVPAAGDGLARPRRAVRDRHALVDRRDAVRGLRDDGPGDGPHATVASCGTTRCPTRCCRRSRSSRSTSATSSPGRSRSRSSSTGPGSGRSRSTALDGSRLPGPPGHLPAALVTVVLANLAADLVYGLLDPRVRT